MSPVQEGKEKPRDTASLPLRGDEFKHITWNGFKRLLKLSHALLNQD